MNKMLKTIACCVLILSATTIIAVAEENIIEEDSAIYDSEYAGPGSPIKLGPRVDEMTPAQMEEAGIVSPTPDNYDPKDYVGKLAYSIGRRDIYDSANGVGRIGVLSERDIVYVRNNDDPKRYYIQFLDRGTLRYGYVDKDVIKAPASNWKKPIEEGKFVYRYDVWRPGTNVAAPIGTDVYAVDDGKYRSMVCYGVHPVDRSKMLVNYENYVEGDVKDGEKSIKVIYGNLSDFENGVSDNTTPSYRQQYRGRVNREVVAEFSASAGDRLGGVGKNGWSAEPSFTTRSMRVQAVL